MNSTISLSPTFKIISFLLVMILSLGSSGQYISPFKYENGTFKNKSADEIRRESAQASTSSNNTPREFLKPKKGPNSSGEFWVDGFCRYRPPTSSTSRYNKNMSEIEYCRTVYPSDTFIYSHNFIDTNAIPLAATSAYRQFHQRMVATVNDGLPFPMYDSLVKEFGAFNIATTRGYKEGSEYQFSRSVSFWVKRKSGSDKMYLKLTTRYPFTNGEDYTDFEVNDNGQFKVSRFCFNCKSPMYKEEESGKTKAWKEGDWNEITVKKDEFNTISFYINQEKTFQYQIPDIPISIRFATFRIEMPYKWEKEKLMYHIGRVTSISYPKRE